MTDTLESLRAEWERVDAMLDASGGSAIPLEGFIDRLFAALEAAERERDRLGKEIATEWGDFAVFIAAIRSAHDVHDHTTCRCGVCEALERWDMRGTNQARRSQAQGRLKRLAEERDALKNRLAALREALLDTKQGKCWCVMNGYKGIHSNHCTTITRALAETAP